MHQTKKTLIFKPLIASAALLAVAAMFIISVLAATASASSQDIGVSSNVASIAGGGNLILKVSHGSADVKELEIDHSLEGTLPEFSVYASESDPYGGDQADFTAAGVVVTYSASAKQWTIDFGPTVTNVIRDQSDGIKFYFALKGDSGAIIWGGMDQVTAENTFAFDVTEGTGDSVELTVADKPAAIVPGVPNTGTAN